MYQLLFDFKNLFIPTPKSVFVAQTFLLSSDPLARLPPGYSNWFQGNMSKPEFVIFLHTSLSPSLVPFSMNGTPSLPFLLLCHNPPPPYPVNHQVLTFLRIFKVGSLLSTEVPAGHWHLSPMYDCDRLLTGLPVSAHASCPPQSTLESEYIF